MTLLKKLQAHLNISATFPNMNKTTLETNIAPQLRAFVVKYLGDHRVKTPVASGFRAEYLPKNVGEHYKTYLNQQAKNKVWGTYIEATALGEAFGCNVFAIPITNKGVQQKPICLYYAGPNAPIVSLYNTNNTHWSISKNASSTKGDGNCLYHAFAQSLQEAVFIEEHKTKPRAQTFYGKQDKNRWMQSDAIQVQQQILIELKSNSFQTPEQAALQLKQEAHRMSLLPQDEQEQITKDYIYALDLAKEDMSYMKHNIYMSTFKTKDLLNNESLHRIGLV